MNNSTAIPLTGPAPLTVAFTDTSTGAPTNWSWDFSDGNSSTEQNPSHEYTEAGTYDVSLTAANAWGSNATVKAGYVNVTQEETPTPTPTVTETTIPGETPYARDYDISDLSTPTAANAAFYQSQMGYLSDPVTDALVGETWVKMFNNIISSEPKDAIFFSNGHGLAEQGADGQLIEGGGILLHDGIIVGQNSSTNTRADGTGARIMSMSKIGQNPGENANNLLLAVYVACYSAKHSSLYGNLVDETRVKGAHNVIGFTEEISNDKSNTWANSFWTRTNDGESIELAAWHAKMDACFSSLNPPGCGGIDSIIISGDDPANTYLQPARYGTM